MGIFSCFNCGFVRPSGTQVSKGVKNSRPANSAMVSASQAPKASLPSGFDATKLSTFGRAKTLPNLGADQLNACLDDLPLVRRKTIQFDHGVTEHRIIHDEAHDYPENQHKLPRIHNPSYERDHYSTTGNYTKARIKFVRQDNI